jgi:DNA-binding response OmpR family regulator
LEDSVLVAMAIETALADRGYETIVAGTLAAAVDRLNGTLPAAALLDLFLPDGNSIALAKSLHDADARSRCVRARTPCPKIAISRPAFASR